MPLRHSGGHGEVQAIASIGYVDYAMKEVGSVTIGIDSLVGEISIHVWMVLNERLDLWTELDRVSGGLSKLGMRTKARPLRGVFVEGHELVDAGSQIVAWLGKVKQ